MEINRTMRQSALLLLLMTMTLSLFAANQQEKVEQVTTAVTLADDLDYIVTGTTPFTEDGLVNITNTEHAVLIFQNVKPTVAINTLLNKYVQINGATAVNGANCQVRLYGTKGSMILPYALTDKPLTVYTEQNFSGEQSNSFGLEDDDGYMVTMTNAQLNNRIRSFRLKRGYMVTFATGKSGYGYQRCFIANNADLEMATLPQILDEKISSYRIFKWNTAGKKGLASNTDATACDALNVISCYDWNEGHNMYPNVECVVNHLYEDYPTSKACGKATWSAHMKTNNEPLNSSDDNPQSLNKILENWQNLMRTGMRLCSPSSWDGSDYTDGSGFLKQFFDSIDARGWRCDLADLHCYWEIDNFNNLGTMQSKYKRPLWISEWFWGSSWGKNGAFSSGKTDGDIAWAIKQICEKLNSYAYVERYFYWNSESKGKVYSGGVTSQIGTYYANMLSGMGYNSKYEKIPNTPRMRGGFRDFRVTTEGSKAIISWHDYDGEYDQVMEVLRKEPGGAWQTWRVIRPEDEEADYNIEDEEYTNGVRYRLHIKSFSGRDYFSSQDMEPGEALETENGLRYVGGNLALNGQFRMGMYGWTSGNGQPISQPWFEVFPMSLTDGYFLQAFANKGKEHEGSLLTAFDIEPNTDYVLRLASQNAGDYVKLDVRTKGETADKNKLTMTNYNYWRTQQGVFNSGEYNEALMSFRWLGASARLGDIELCRLFNTREEAIADGVAQARRKVQLVKEWNTALPDLNTEMEQRATEAAGTDDEILAKLTLAVNDLLQAIDDKRVLDSLLTVAKTVDYMNFAGREELQEAVETASNVEISSQSLAEARLQLQQALDGFVSTAESEKQPQSPSFASTDGWTVKAGTYKDGDQSKKTQQDKTCWNAWWSGISAAEGTAKTMEVVQKIDGLAEGLYWLECKASTQHYCLGDQHAYIKVRHDGDTDFALEQNTPMLTRDYLDVAGTLSAWQTLTTTPVYVAPTDTIYIGFISSKQGTTDYAWRRYGNTETDNNTGDLREGWWCATDFRLLYHPIMKLHPAPGKWNTVCLPYAYMLPEGSKFYQVAGLLSDYSRVCLEEVNEVQQGYPYIYITEQEDVSEVTFYTYGEAIVRPVTRGTNNLVGNFASSAKVTSGSYILHDDGEWYRLGENEERPKFPVYSAVIRKAEGLPLYSEWNGPTMVIHNVADELGEPDGISLTSNAKDNAVYYQMDGRPATAKPSSGLHIKVAGKKATKVFTK